MNRPKVICHILSSLDGRIEGGFFALPDTMALAGKYARIRSDYNPDAIINGATTCAEIFADGYIESLTHTEKKFTREDHIVLTDLNKFAVCIDTQGTLKWIGNTAQRGGTTHHIVQILTENVSDDYITHLRENNISYLFAGKDKLNIPLALEKLKQKLGVNTALLCGGGAINWSFLQADCIDELSLVIAPAAEGERNTATVFDRSEYFGGVPKDFILTEAKRVNPNGVWLKYKPNK